MAIKVDDRLKSNVSDGILTTGDQIAISTNTDNHKISTLKTSISINDKKYNLAIATEYDLTTVNDIPNIINYVNDTIITLTSNLIETPIIDNIKASNYSISFDNNTDYFGVSTITNIDDLHNIFLGTFHNNDIKFPLVTLLSAPIEINLINNGLIYSTEYNPYKSLKIIPKNSLVCVLSTTHLNVATVDDYNIWPIDKCIQILSIPTSANTSDNDYETRISNIEKLLSLSVSTSLND